MTPCQDGELVHIGAVTWWMVEAARSVFLSLEAERIERGIADGTGTPE